MNAQNEYGIICLSSLDFFDILSQSKKRSKGWSIYRLSCTPSITTYRVKLWPLDQSEWSQPFGLNYIHWITLLQTTVEIANLRIITSFGPRKCHVTATCRQVAIRNGASR